jgi:glycosyltransferase involved in cell wall biosynthesis
MERILLVDSAFPINVRNQKILNSLKSLSSSEIKYCTWHRDHKSIPSGENINFIFSKFSLYGHRFKKLLNVLGYARFLKKTIISYKPTVIIASHWDMLFLTSLLKPAHNCVLIYENLDMPTSESPFFRRIVRWIERLAIQKTDKIILASRFFAHQYEFFNKPKLIAENKPYRTEVLADTRNKVQEKLIITFLGTVRYFNIFKNLIEAVKDFDVELQIWGDGPDEGKLRAMANDIPNIKFFGRFDYAIINTIYANSDLIWAVYPSNDYNVKFAISNKYHECLLFGRPGVFAEGTHLGDMVRNKKIGFTVNPNDVLSIRDLIQKIVQAPQLLLERAENIKKDEEARYWEDEQRKLVDFITTV